VGQQCGEGALRLRRRRVPHQDPEPFGAVLDVGQQGQGGALHQDARLCFLGQGVVDGVEEEPELVVHHLGVQPFLRTEVLVDDRLGHPCARRDFFNGGPVKAPDGEKAASDVDQLAPPLQAGHACPRRVVAHISIMHHRSRAGLQRDGARSAGRESAR
jgi:hypothetical protein